MRFGVRLAGGRTNASGRVTLTTSNTDSPSTNEISPYVYVVPAGILLTVRFAAGPAAFQSPPLTESEMSPPPGVTVLSAYAIGVCAPSRAVTRTWSEPLESRHLL